MPVKCMRASVPRWVTTTAAKPARMARILRFTLGPIVTELFGLSLEIATRRFYGGRARTRPKREEGSQAISIALYEAE